MEIKQVFSKLTSLALVLFILILSPVALVSAQGTDIESISAEENVDTSLFDDTNTEDERDRCSFFEDLDREHILCKYLRTARKLGIVNPNARFRPLFPITRGQFSALVVRAFDLEATIDSEPFADVSEDHTFYTDIMTLKELGIVNGATRDDGVYYYPARPVLRGHAAKILANTIDSQTDVDVISTDDIDLELEFNDIDVNNPFLRNVRFLIKVFRLGELDEPVIRGYSDGRIRLERPVTRIEAITMVIRAMMAENAYSDLVLLEDELTYCEYNDEIYTNNETFEAIDQCNSCTCLEGSVACTEKACVTDTTSDSDGSVTDVSGGLDNPVTLPDTE